MRPTLIKRSISILIAALALLLLTVSLQPVRTILAHRYWATLYHLSRTAVGSYVTELPWPGQQRKNYAGLTVYHDANLRLPPSTPDRVVFLGDSITERWAKEFPSQFFPGKPYMGRGIGYQVTGQMIWRFHQDVIALHPRAVIILAGTNDVAFHKSFAVQTKKNIEIMVEMAQRHHVQVILCSIPPLSAHTPEKQVYVEHLVLVFNDWLRSYATQHHLAFVDYYSALVDADGQMPPSLTADGIHPNLAGYARMRPLAQQAIDSLPPK